jgi:hypothetical protein
MKRAFSVWSAGLLFTTLLLLAGCVSYERHVVPGKGLDGVKRFFVVSNQNDNHGIAQNIEAALKIRGNEAESGPLTMMPDDAQVIVGYEDRWEWDFGDHLNFLQLTVRNRKSGDLLASVRFSAKIPKGKTTAIVVGELIDRLLEDRKP